MRFWRVRFRALRALIAVGVNLTLIVQLAPAATLAEANERIEAWRKEYNERRPHGALEEWKPNECANEVAAGRDFIGIQTTKNSLWCPETEVRLTTIGLFHAKAQRPQSTYGSPHGPELFNIFTTQDTRFGIKNPVTSRQALLAQQAQDRRLPLPQVFSEGQLLSPHVCHGEAKWHLAGVPLERPQ